jgi:hypothetical protein
MLYLLCLVFSILALLRLIEMSFQFDGVDILWTAIFTIGALIFGSAAKSDTV